jgi:hypothetical protein
VPGLVLPPAVIGGCLGLLDAAIELVDLTFKGRFGVHDEPALFDLCIVAPEGMDTLAITEVVHLVGGHTTQGLFGRTHRLRHPA